MKTRCLSAILLAGVFAAVSADLFAQDAPALPKARAGPRERDGGRQGQRGGRGGGMMGMGMGRGTVGTVTEATADHHILKTELGDIYTVHFSVNTA